METRELRFAIPPFVLFTSLFWAAVVDPNIHVLELLEETASDDIGIAAIIGLLATGGVAVIALGFLISAISIFLLRVLFLIIGQNYEAHVPTPALQAIGRHLQSGQDPCPDQAFYAVAAYDHAILPSGLNEWTQRRWNTFMVSINCCIALGLSHVLGFYLGISGGYYWGVPSLVLIAILLVNGFVARYHTLQMISFASSLPHEKWKEENREKDDA